MELEKILKLVEAGFNKSEIVALLTPTPAPVPEPVPEPTPAPVPEPTPAPVPEPKPAPAVDNSTVLLDAINKLTNTIQSQAITSSSIPGISQAQSAEQVLAEIIHPTFKEESK